MAGPAWSQGGAALASPVIGTAAPFRDAPKGREPLLTDDQQGRERVRFK